MSDPTPGYAGHAAPDPTTQPTPEPLISAEIVRSLLIAAGAGSWGIPLPIVLQVAMTGVALIGSAALTMISRGRVWALRRGVDIDQVVDTVQARSRHV